MSPEIRILIIDDQESAREFLGRYLESLGYAVSLADSIAQAMDILEKQPIDLVASDLRMPGVDGLEGLRRIKQFDCDLPVILLTAFGTVESAVDAMRLGAFDYLRKPLDTEEFEIVVARALEHRRLVAENKALKAEVSAKYRLENLIGQGAAMTQLIELIRKVAPVNIPVLITGESGTGKDLVARAIHGLSERAEKKYLSVNCAAIPENLLESELFGHTKGAFSGAERERLGFFREADGGTLFLDEIGEMSLAHQAKLLTVLETGELIPVGADHPVQVDVRLLAATNRSLDELIAQKRFRSDLMFRIETIRVPLPPLRDRREDMPQLVAHFLERAKLRPGQVAPRMSSEAMRVLMQHPWPGNIRELKHAIEHAVLVTDGAQIRPLDLPSRISGVSGISPDGVDAFAGSFREAKDRFERHYLADLVDRAEGNISRAAMLAGVHRATLHEKIKKLGIKRKGLKED